MAKVKSGDFSDDPVFKWANAEFLESEGIMVEGVKRTVEGMFRRGLAHAAIRRLRPGRFEKFLATQKRFHCRRTAYNHMAIAEQICELAGCKEETILLVGPGESLQFDLVALAKALNTVCPGNTLAEVTDKLKQLHRDKALAGTESDPSKQSPENVTRKQLLPSSIPNDNDATSTIVNAAATANATGPNGKPEVSPSSDSATDAPKSANGSANPATTPNITSKKCFKHFAALKKSYPALPPEERMRFVQALKDLLSSIEQAE